LEKLAKTCKYGNLEGEIIKDRIVVGVKSNNIRWNLVAEEELTLPSRKRWTRNTLKQSLVLNDMTLRLRKWKSIESQIAKNISNNYHGRSVEGAASTKKEVECKFCGLMHEYGAKFCPAYGKTCDKWKKMNHFSRVCLSAPSANSAESYRPRRQATATRRQQVNVVDEAEDEEYIYALSDEHVYEVQPSPSVKNMKKTLTTKVWVQRSNSAFEL
jgi:hypothetical protein